MNGQEPDTYLISPMKKRVEESNRSHSKIKPSVQATTPTSSAPNAIVKKGSLHA